jgi:hypothetical protein
VDYMVVVSNDAFATLRSPDGKLQVQDFAAM